jgi:hypothetical protein
VNRPPDDRHETGGAASPHGQDSGGLPAEHRPEDSVPPAETETTSRWEDYIDVFISPAELFQRRAADRVAPPLITLLALSVAFYFILLPANGMAMRASAGESAEAAQMMEQFGMLFQMLGSIFVPITYLIMLSLVAALLLVIGRLAEIRTVWSRTLLIATYGGFIYLLAQIAGGVAILIHGEAGLDVVRDVSFGPLRFIGSTDTEPVMTAILRRFDIFTIWQAVVWGIGVSVIYRVSRARGMAVAFATWAIMTIPGVVMAMIGIGQGPPQAG